MDSIEVRGLVFFMVSVHIRQMYKVVPDRGEHSLTFLHFRHKALE